jgi:hypothetical protein
VNAHSTGHPRVRHNSTVHGEGTTDGPTVDADADADGGGRRRRTKYPFENR